MQYKIVEPNEDPRMAVIEKTGHVIKFSMFDVERHISELKSKIQEMEAQAAINVAKMTNIEQHHPFVTTMSVPDLFTAHMYMENKAVVETVKKNVATLAKQIEEYEAEKAEIFEQIPEVKPAPVEESQAQPQAPKVSTDVPEGSVISPIQNP